MLAKKEKISCRQAIILFLILSASPAIRLFPAYSAKIAKQSGWLSPLVNLFAFVLLILILQSFFKKHKESDLSDVIFAILGNVLGRIVAVLYLVWILILTALYVRYYAERILSTVLPNTYYDFLVIPMLILIVYVLRKGIVSFARTNEIFFIGFNIMFIIIFLLLAPKIRMENLTPISYIDIFPIVKSGYVLLAISGYVLFIFFFGDKINDKEHIKRIGIRAGIYFTFMSFIIILQTLGSLGYSITQRLPIPYFVGVKRISILEVIERIESVVLSGWIISDFIIISVFIYIAASIIKSIFRLPEATSLISPLAIFSYIFSLYLVRDKFELADFSSTISLPFNVFMEYIMPVFLWVVGKIRGKI